MVQDADALVVAKVLSAKLGRVMFTSGGQNELPFTRVDLNVEQSIGGDVEGVITVEQTGGEGDTLRYYVDGEGGPYQVGGRVLLFLARQPDSVSYYVSHAKGRLNVTGGAVQSVNPDDTVAQMLHNQPLLSATRTIASLLRSADP
jgi:hypothetical protein